MAALAVNLRLDNAITAPDQLSRQKCYWWDQECMLLASGVSAPDADREVMSAGHFCGGTWLPSLSTTVVDARLLMLWVEVVRVTDGEAFNRMEA